MQNDTKHKKKKAPIICAAIVIGLLAAYLAVILFALIGEAHGELFALIFLLLYGGLIVAVGPKFVQRTNPTGHKHNRITIM